MNANNTPAVGCMHEPDVSRVADAYRWLEDRHSHSTESWLNRQKNILSNYFARLEPLSDLASRVRAYLDSESIDQPGVVGDHEFFRRQRIGEEQASIVVREINGLERVLCSSAHLGGSRSVRIHTISPGAELLSYEVRQGGQHTKEIHVIDVRTGTQWPDFIAQGLARGFVFDPSCTGYYYSHEFSDARIQTGHNFKVMHHEMGASSLCDEPILELPHSEARKLILRASEESLVAIYTRLDRGIPVIDLYSASFSKPTQWTALRLGAPGPFSPFFHRGQLYAYEGTARRVVELDLETGMPSKVVIPPRMGTVDNLVVSSGRIVVLHRTGRRREAEIWTVEGQREGSIPLDPDRTWELLPAHSAEASSVFLRCDGYNSPPELHQCDLSKQTLSLWWGADIPPRQPICEGITARQASYTSRDGIEVPLTLLESDGSNSSPGPTVVTTYGGFGLSLEPHFSPLIAILIELGFKVAIPDVRGGGGTGQEWHEAATRGRKQKSVDDLISACEWLLSVGVSTPGKIVAVGSSHSGLLASALAIQRPDLVAATVCIAPLLDMLRYHLFDRASVWMGEYGNPDDPEERAALASFSPYHRIHDDYNYPATLFVCGDQDTRCNPAHSRKMVARLQDRRCQRSPILLDHSVNRGHSPGLPLSVRIEALTQRIAFICNEVGVAVSPKVGS